MLTLFFLAFLAQFVEPGAFFANGWHTLSLEHFATTKYLKALGIAERGDGRRFFRARPTIPGPIGEPGIHCPDCLSARD